MKKHFLMILIAAALIAAAFFPGPGSAVQATGIDQPALQEPARPTEHVAMAASPVMQVVVGSIGALFALLTFLPALLAEEDPAKEWDTDCTDETRLLG